MGALYALNGQKDEQTMGSTGRATAHDPFSAALQANIARAQSEPGFFRNKVEQATADGDGESQKLNQVLFVPYDMDDPCPCGSIYAFGDCCQPHGPRRPFVKNPDGTFGLFVMYSETWPWDKFEQARALFGKREDVYVGEVSDDVCFYNYRAGGRGIGAELFGTIEINRTHLIIEALSENRYETLRQFVEDVLGEALPAGKKTVELYAPGARAVAGGVEDESGGKTDRSRDISDSQGDERPPLLERYRLYRERSRYIMSAAAEQVLPTELKEAGKMLGWLAGGMVAVDDDEIDLLMDFTLHDIRRHGKPIIEDYMRRTPPVSELEEELYSGYMNAKASFYMVDRITTEAVIVRDLLAEGESDIKLVDFGLITTLKPGSGLFARLIPVEEFVMTSGWAHIVAEDKVEPLLDQYRDLLARTSHRRYTAVGVRLFRKFSETVQIRGSR